MRSSNALPVRLLSFALIALLFAACGEKKKEADPKPAKEAAATLIGASPEIPAELEKAAWGANEEDTVKALGWKDDSADSATHEGVRYSLWIDDKAGLEKLRVVLDDADGAVAKAVEAWGEGAEIDDLGTKKKRYFNPEKELLATVVAQKDYDDKPIVEIELQRYVPLDKALGLTDKVALPPALAKLTFGMSKDDAAAAAGMDDGYNRSPENADISFRYYVPEDSNRLQTVYVEVENGDLRTLLNEKWGAPKVGKDISNDELLLWHNPEAGIRAVYSKSTAGFVKEKVEFTAYVPLAKVIGTEKGKLGLDAPMLGATWDEIQASYKPYVNDKYVYYLPTDYADSSFSSFSFDYDKEGKANKVNFSADFSQYPEVKDELLGVLKAVYGEPKEGADFLNRPALLFNEAPKVLVRFNDISTAWDITISAE